jgi:hypothetical protein
VKNPLKGQSSQKVSFLPHLFRLLFHPRILPCLPRQRRSASDPAESNQPELRHRLPPTPPSTENDGKNGQNGRGKFKMGNDPKVGAKDVESVVEI